MSDIAIRVEGLSKRYRIGVRERAHDTLGGAITDLVRRPLLNLRRLRELSTFDDSEDRDDVLWALRDVSFEVARGEIVGVIGRNGSGKSTLIKILSRITTPTRGRVELSGRVGALLEVGTAFHPDLTGRENVFLNGSVLGMRKREIEARFDEIVAFSEVEKFIDMPVKRYSTGMALRLAFSVAAHLEAEILLVDEVLAVGDVKFQEKCVGKMQDVTTLGRTVLFVSHNMGSVQRLCDRGILLHDGELLMNGPTREVVSGYLGLGAERLGERVWKEASSAPGDDTARVHAVRVVDGRGAPLDRVRRARPGLRADGVLGAQGSRAAERHAGVPQRPRRAPLHVDRRLGGRGFARAGARDGPVPLHLPGPAGPAEQRADVRVGEADRRRPGPRRAAGCRHVQRARLHGPGGSPRQLSRRLARNRRAAAPAMGVRAPRRDPCRRLEARGRV